MGLESFPEVKMARRIIQKHSITIPFNIDDLVKQYAKIIYKQIPVDGVDGICLNLKRPGKTPTVIVNVDSARTRQKFTLAHELAHIIIPWHLGTFIDDLDEKVIHPNTQYWLIETEANRFASELLMPFNWIYSLYKENSDPTFLFSQICEKCGVSEMAASIRLHAAISEIEDKLMPADWILQLYKEDSNLANTQKVIVENTMLNPKRVAERMVQLLPGKITFCLESERIVIGNGSTRDTHSYYQREGEEFLEHPFPYFQSYFLYTLANLNTHWWVVDTNFKTIDDSRSWRDILNKIVDEISPTQGEKKFKATVNGKLSGANGNWERKNPGLGIEYFIKDAILRFNNPEFEEFIKHRDFGIFIRKRSEDFFQ